MKTNRMEITKMKVYDSKQGFIGVIVSEDEDHVEVYWMCGGTAYYDKKLDRRAIANFIRLEDVRIVPGINTTYRVMIGSLVCLETNDGSDALAYMNRALKFPEKIVTN